MRAVPIRCTVDYYTIGREAKSSGLLTSNQMLISTKEVEFETVLGIIDA